MFITVQGYDKDTGELVKFDKGTQALIEKKYVNVKNMVPECMYFFLPTTEKLSSAFLIPNYNNACYDIEVVAFRNHIDLRNPDFTLIQFLKACKIYLSDDFDAISDKKFIRWVDDLWSFYKPYMVANLMYYMLPIALMFIQSNYIYDSSDVEIKGLAWAVCILLGPLFGFELSQLFLNFGLYMNLTNVFDILAYLFILVYEILVLIINNHASST